MRSALIILLFVAAAPALAQDGPKSTSIYTAGAHTSNALRLQNLDIAADGVVRGMLASQSSSVIREVTLLVHHTWNWQNEMRPGDDSPGRSTYVHISGDVPALGTLHFEYVPSPPLPERNDGTFTTSVDISAYTEVDYHKELR